MDLILMGMPINKGLKPSRYCFERMVLIGKPAMGKVRMAYCINFPITPPIPASFLQVIKLVEVTQPSPPNFLDILVPGIEPVLFRPLVMIALKQCFLTVAGDRFLKAVQDPVCGFDLLY